MPSTLTPSTLTPSTLNDGPIVSPAPMSKADLATYAAGLPDVTLYEQIMTAPVAGKPRCRCCHGSGVMTVVVASPDEIGPIDGSVPINGSVATTHQSRPCDCTRRITLAVYTAEQARRQRIDNARSVSDHTAPMSALSAHTAKRHAAAEANLARCTATLDAAKATLRSATTAMTTATKGAKRQHSAWKGQHTKLYKANGRTLVEFDANCIAQIQAEIQRGLDTAGARAKEDMTFADAIKYSTQDMWEFMDNMRKTLQRCAGEHEKARATLLSKLGAAVQVSIEKGAALAQATIDAAEPHKAPTKQAARHVKNAERKVAAAKSRLARTARLLG